MPYITRVSKIKGYGKLLGGMDIGGVFKDGHVYAFTRVGEEIICKDLGPHAEDPLIKRGAKFYSIMMNGVYLLTEKEDKEEKKKRKEEDEL